MKILFIGDIVGKSGRDIVSSLLYSLKQDYGIDLVIANGENATHGKGLISHHYDELIDAGIDCITLGNHYDSKNEIRRYIDRVDQIVRPINLAHEYPGDGSVVFDVKGYKVKVINVLGNAFMGEEVSNPYYAVLDEINDTDVIYIVDLHAEATGEKKAVAYALDGKVSAVIGTHTHVQTNDAEIFSEGTAFISDVGMTGFKDGILGFEKSSIINKTIFGKTGKFEVPDEGKGMLSAVVLNIDELSKKCTQIQTICYKEK